MDRNALENVIGSCYYASKIEKSLSNSLEQTSLIISSLSVYYEKKFEEDRGTFFCFSSVTFRTLMQKLGLEGEKEIRLQC